MAGASGIDSSTGPFFTLGFLVLALGIVQNGSITNVTAVKKLATDPARS
jgi:hypothetical protein